jgi:hypothetical protein
MLDVVHPALPNPENDQNTYTLGKMGAHNVVIACMSSGVYGMTSATSVKGSGRGLQHQQHQPDLGEEGDFAVHARPSPTPNLTTKREGKVEKDACWLPKLGWLATYVGCVPCVSTCPY